MDQGSVHKCSPSPQQLFTVFAAHLPRWPAPASHSHSSWKTALLSEILYTMSGYWQSPCLRPSCLAYSVCLSCNVTFCGSRVKSRGMRKEQKNNTSGTKIEIIAERNEFWAIILVNYTFETICIWNTGYPTLFGNKALEHFCGGLNNRT